MTKEELDELRQEIATLCAQLHSIEEKKQALRDAELEYCNEICKNAAGKYFCNNGKDPLTYYYVKSVYLPKKSCVWGAKVVEISIYSSSNWVYVGNTSIQSVVLEHCIETTREEFENAQRFYEYFKEGEKRFKKDFREKMKELGLKTK